VLTDVPDVHYDDPVAIHVAGDVVTVEIEFHGVTYEGVEVAWPAIDVFKLEDGKIKEVTISMDMAEVMRKVRQPGPPEKRLELLVRHAAEKSAFYRRRFEELGLDAEQVAGDLSKLPPTRHDELAAAPAEFLTVPDSLVRQVLPSDGVLVPLTAPDVEDMVSTWARAFQVAGVGSGDVVQPLLAHPALPEAVRRAKARLVAAAGQPLDAHIRTAADAGTTTVTGPPERVAEFRARAHELGVDVSAIRAVGAWGTPETGDVAAECASGSWHAFTDMHVVEIDGDGELLVTPLGRKGLPLLRYATGARTAWVDGPCPCGSELPRLAPIQ
jgi:phenylacetate-CoA ligase